VGDRIDLNRRFLRDHFSRRPRPQVAATEQFEEFVDGVLRRVGIRRVGRSNQCDCVPSGLDEHPAGRGLVSRDAESVGQSPRADKHEACRAVGGWVGNNQPTVLHLRLLERVLVK
jgi:hypothetical protein